MRFSIYNYAQYFTDFVGYCAQLSPPTGFTCLQSLLGDAHNQLHSNLPSVFIGADVDPLVLLLLALLDSIAGECSRFP